MVKIDFEKIAGAFEERAKQRRFFDDPVFWAETHGLFLWSKQREVMESIVRHPKTLVITGNGVGKTRLAATAVGWWVATRPVDASTVVTTATNWRQVKNILWKEIPRIKAAADTPGRITADAQWKVDSQTQPVAFGMKPDDKDESGFQGVHDRYVLAVIDEAGGVSKEIFTAVDAVTTNADARILAIANPNDVNGHMANVYQEEMVKKPEDRIWNIIQFGAFESPNFTGEKVPAEVAEALVQRDWVEARRREWGEDDPRYIARVLGRFPEKTDAGLFNLGAVVAAMRTHEAHEVGESDAVRLGVDVARYGSDSSVVAMYQGGKVDILGEYRGKSGPELSRIVGEWAHKTGAVEVRVDGVGVGVSVLDSLEPYLPDDCSVFSIVGNAASPDKTRWYNYRAAMYDQVSHAISRGELSIPDNDNLYRDITNITYTYRGSALLLHSKEDLRRKKIPSPDVLDAVVYAAHDIDLLSEGLLGRDEVASASTTDYDSLDYGLDTLLAELRDRDFDPDWSFIPY